MALGVAACGAATPSSTRSQDVTATSSPTQPTRGAIAPAARESPGYSLGDLGESLDIRAVDAEFSSRVLEFASTGWAVIASAGTSAEFAPDLYSILPRTGEPEVLWRNPGRDHSIVKMAGDGDTIAFVDMSVEGDPGWTLRLIPDSGEVAVVLDEYHGDSEVASLVPAFSVYWPYVAWTAFDEGPDGLVSRLLVAQSPDWNPRILAERAAARAELWFPHIYGSSLLYTELTYSEDRETDERSIWLTDVHGTRPQRLDATGLATMPVMNQFATAWKETERGFHMLNWGVIEAYDADAGTSLPVTDNSANFPSAGDHYMTWWRADTTRLEVWDARRKLTQEVITSEGGAYRVVRPHVGGGLLTWMFADETTDAGLGQIQYAFLP
jgi:hypothetical protein